MRCSIYLVYMQELHMILVKYRDREAGLTNRNKREYDISNIYHLYKEDVTPYQAVAEKRR